LRRSPFPNLPLLHFDATRVFYLSLRLIRSALVDYEPPHQAPRLSFFALQHFRVKRPFFSLSRASEKRCAALQKSHPQGLATLSMVSALFTLGSLFQLPTLLGFALQSFAPSRGSKNPFEFSSPLRRFPIKPPGLMPALQRLCPPGKAVSLAASRRLRSGRDPGSPGPSGLSGSPVHLSREEASLFLSDPPVLGLRLSSRRPNRPDLRAFGKMASASPFTGR
jgi:hypothetical protein